MAGRAAADFAADNRAFAAGFDVLVQEGYTAYMLPEECELDYRPEGDSAVVNSQGNFLTDGTKILDPLYRQLRMPQESLYHWEDVALPVESANPNATEIVPTKVWHYRGAKWLDEGYSPQQVINAKRFERLRVHLGFAAIQYMEFVNWQGPPASLLELEKFMGVARNPAGWTGVNLVQQYSEADSLPGNLFVGWHDSGFRVRVNLGPEIREFALVQSSKGGWVMSANSGLSY